MKAACQAALVIETRLSRYGTITSHLPAAPASVVACCAAHSQLLEACPAAASVLLLLLVTVAIIHARKRPRTAPGAPLWPRASSVLPTAGAAWGRCVALLGSVSRALKKQGAKHKQSPVVVNVALLVKDTTPGSQERSTDATVNVAFISERTTERTVAVG